MNNSNIHHKKSFTLAETLVVLAVIGVVAALIIPPLVNGYQEMVWHATWKKQFSTLSQATTMLATETNVNFTGVFTGTNGTNNIRDKYRDYLKYIKECDSAQSWGDCIPLDWKGLNGLILYPTYWNPAPSAVLQDGTILYFATSEDPSGASTCTIAIPESGVVDSCGQIMVDVNGQKGPNTLGKDIYRASIVKKGRLVPFGAGYNTCSGWGDNCSAYYLTR